MIISSINEEKLDFIKLMDTNGYEVVSVETLQASGDYPSQDQTAGRPLFNVIVQRKKMWSRPSSNEENRMATADPATGLVTVGDISRLIDIVCEIKTCGGPTGQAISPRTARELQKLKDELYSER